ncbi:MAG: nucleotidyltransferase family protein [Kiritimatiellae bacterium]|nr:nucleotidyltransferase family protein [Kiritimatiellia bacterium]
MNEQTRATSEWEWALLCELCRQAITGTKPTTSCTNSTISSIDWNVFLSMAKRHGVMALLSKALEDHGNKHLPTQVRQSIIRVAAVATARDDYFLKRAAEIDRVLTTAKIPYALIKGPVLGQVAWGESHLRTYEDLDILLQPDQFLQARRRLAQSGYTPRQKIPEHAALAHMQAGWDCNQFNFPEGKGFLELTCRIAPRFLFPSLGEDIWSETTRIKLTNCSLPTLRAEPMLILLCVHGTKHTWSQLRWLADIAGLISRTPDMDWADVQTLAERYRAKRMLALGLILTRDTLDVTLPEPAERFIQMHSQALALIPELHGQWTASSDTPNTPKQNLRFYLNVRDSGADKFAMLWCLAITPSLSDWQWLKLPDWLSPLYYILRPIRLALRALRRR